MVRQRKILESRPSSLTLIRWGRGGGWEKSCCSCQSSLFVCWLLIPCTAKVCFPSLIVCSSSLLKSHFQCQATSWFITVSFSGYTNNAKVKDVYVMSHLLSCRVIQGHLLLVLIISKLQVGLQSWKCVVYFFIAAIVVVKMGASTEGYVSESLHKSQDLVLLLHIISD